MGLWWDYLYVCDGIEGFLQYNEEFMRVASRSPSPEYANGIFYVPQGLFVTTSSLRRHFKTCRSARGNTRCAKCVPELTQSAIARYLAFAYTGRG